MSGNGFGTLFQYQTFGESHGPAIGCVVDGVPPRIPLSEKDIQKYLDRRKPGKSRHVTQRRESDTVSIISGVFEGRTTGTPIGLMIENEDQRSKDYSKISDRFRPGHADYTYLQKYGINDYRGGGRASARETCMRVAAGAIAKKYLYEKLGMRIRGFLAQLGPIRIDFRGWDGIEEALQLVGEPHVEHFVGLVENHRLQVVEDERAPPEMIQCPSRCRYHDVDPAPQRPNLLIEGLASVNRDH